MRAGVIVARTRPEGEQIADVLDLTGWQIITPHNAHTFGRGYRCKPVVLTNDPDLLTAAVVDAIKPMTDSQPLTVLTILPTLAVPCP
ncbi:hypothetical protein E3G52_000351 [Mycobacteroides abscessus]|uniref:hypothetical protein n=1 Tax=Mycobacteroides abscessus TaxID=36809 RepID=UPI001877E1F7|nr:hypothetical protein [Mycobacteroides abscessus]MBE5453487.1 hypothetical protein [Mycobacteroides abscessus]